MSSDSEVHERRSQTHDMANTNKRHRSVDGESKSMDSSLLNDQTYVIGDPKNRIQMTPDSYYDNVQKGIYSGDKKGIDSGDDQLYKK